MFVQSIVFYKENISLEKTTKKGVKSLFSKEFFYLTGKYFDLGLNKIW